MVLFGRSMDTLRYAPGSMEEEYLSPNLARSREATFSAGKKLLMKLPSTLLPVSGRPSRRKNFFTDGSGTRMQPIISYIRVISVSSFPQIWERNVFVVFIEGASSCPIVSLQVKTYVVGGWLAICSIYLLIKLALIVCVILIGSGVVAKQVSKEIENKFLLIEATSTIEESLGSVLLSDISVRESVSWLV